MAHITNDCTGYRPMTDEEVDAWYAAQSMPFDSAGEPWICDRIQRVRVSAGTEVTVLRKRCTARVGWSTASGFSEVSLPNGTVLKVPREVVEDLTAKPSIGSGTPVDARISLFAVEVEQMISGFYGKQFPELKAPNIKVEWGRRYAKLVKKDSNGGCSAFCFVDRTNGDVLKTASWSAPAKHARGSVMSENILSGVGPYGAHYL